MKPARATLIVINFLKEINSTILKHVEAYLNPTSLIAQPAALAIMELLQRCNSQFPPRTCYDLLSVLHWISFIAVCNFAQMLNRPLLKLAASSRYGARLFRSARFTVPSVQQMYSSVATLPEIAPIDLFEPTPVHTHLRETVRAFAEAEVDPQANDFNRHER
jgi:hypothetical protein